MHKLNRILSKSVFSRISARDLVYFIKSSIEERENFKFEFNKSLSLALEFLAKAGEFLGVMRQDLAYLDVSAIESSRFYRSSDELTEFWSSLIREKQKRYDYNSMLILPPVIQSESDFEVVYFCSARPNFITQKCVTGKIVNLEADPRAGLKDKIVLLKKADPGFDWIFATNIKGLITKYGGAGSHMAIRCAEFGIPAAIGCGEQIFNNISNWKEIKLDCKDKKIEQFYS
jgi:phosphoenolpyruvate synthase/pyruvate phosphate dikinase